MESLSQLKPKKPIYNDTFSPLMCLLILTRRSKAATQKNDVAGRTTYTCVTSRQIAHLTNLLNSIMETMTCFYSD